MNPTPENNTNYIGTDENIFDNLLDAEMCKNGSKTAFTGHKNTILAATERHDRKANRTIFMSISYKANSTNHLTISKSE